MEVLASLDERLSSATHPNLIKLALASGQVAVTHPDITPIRPLHCANYLVVLEVTSLCEIGSTNFTPQKA